MTAGSSIMRIWGNLQIAFFSVTYDSIIDRTKGIRPSTYFQGEGIVAHAMFGNPFDDELIEFIAPSVRKVLEEHPEGKVNLHVKKNVVVMEGPAFSTRAESLIYRQLGVRPPHFCLVSLYILTNLLTRV